MSALAIEAARVLRRYRAAAEKPHSTNRDERGAELAQIVLQLAMRVEDLEAELDLEEPS